MRTCSSRSCTRQPRESFEQHSFDSLESRVHTPAIHQQQQCELNWSSVAMKLIQALWMDQDGQDIAEYAVMLAVILVIVVATVRIVGTNSNNVFSEVASSVQ